MLRIPLRRFNVNCNFSCKFNPNMKRSSVCYLYICNLIRVFQFLTLQRTRYFEYFTYFCILYSVYFRCFEFPIDASRFTIELLIDKSSRESFRNDESRKISQLNVDEFPNRDRSLVSIVRYSPFTWVEEQTRRITRRTISHVWIRMVWAMGGTRHK